MGRNSPACAHLAAPWDRLVCAARRGVGRYAVTRGGTRTRNLLLRGEAPYPLGHTGNDGKIHGNYTKVTLQHVVLHTGYVRTHITSTHRLPPHTYYIYTQVASSHLLHLHTGCFFTPITSIHRLPPHTYHIYTQVASSHLLHLHTGCILTLITSTHRLHFSTPIDPNKIIVRDYLLHVNSEILGCTLRFRNFDVNVKSQQNCCQRLFITRQF